MADTAIQEKPNTLCSDCGKKGTSISHWGPMVPPGEVGDFCVRCFRERVLRDRQRFEPWPLGYKREENKDEVGAR